MPTLSISDFSCIKEARLELSRINVIIGAQGSGKSVTTKLLYFFNDMMINMPISAEKGLNVDEYKQQLSRQFCLWFPPSAWGSGRFNITYTSGWFSARVLRRTTGGSLSDNVAIRFSDEFSKSYGWAVSQFRRAKDIDTDDDLERPVSESLERTFEVRERIERRMKSLDEARYTAQTFIPAGRAFFTSIGRLVAGFEQAGSLDPVTIKFARLFAGIRDRQQRYRMGLRRANSEDKSRRRKFMHSLFGGDLRFGEDADYVESNDGRRIPFTYLSSGQQELLPMWMLMDYFGDIDDMGFSRNSRSRARDPSLVYIEEPEAHLFPKAQSELMEFLIGSVHSERSARSLIITTHSPYIMAKLNVFLKAGQLARRKKKNNEISEIVPRECWLDESQLSAFSMENGTLRSIMDDGLIDAVYLDGISDVIANEFSQLLSIEASI